MNIHVYTAAILGYLLFLIHVPFNNCARTTTTTTTTKEILRTEEEILGFQLCEANENKFGKLEQFCLNNGVCYKTLKKANTDKNQKNKNKNDLFCSCTSEFTGKRCEIPNVETPEIVEPSENSVLINSENKKVTKRPITVIQTTTSKTLVISCPEWYVCLNGGTCVVDLLVGPKCVCPNEFEGLNCGKAKYCPNMNECMKSCAWGFKRKNSCDVCECKCLNEYNFQNEVRLELVNGTKVVNDKFCNKTCKYGYERDEFDCYKCKCINDTTTTVQARTQKMQCPNNYCKDGEVCKFFNSTLFQCPIEQKDCHLYANQNFIPICVPSLLSESCLDPVQYGECKIYTTKYFFDLHDKRCKPFEYRGCGANKNNFNSLDECSRECGQVYSNVPDEYENTEHTYDYDTILDVNELEDVNPEEQMDDVTHSIESKSSTSTYNKVTEPDTNQYQSVTDTFTTNGCQWICDISCPFGYKIDQNSGCYVCECLELNMTECGVPCYFPGTKTCMFSNRANSRPKCLCHENYNGVYCETYCDIKEELFSLDLDKRYLYGIDKLRFVINDLKNEVTRSYKFEKNSVKTIKVVIEPLVAIEFVLANTASDPEFCAKSYILHNDIRSKTFMLKDMEADSLDTNKNNDIFDSNPNYWGSSDNSPLPPNLDTGIWSHTPSLFSNSVVFIAIIVTCFLILLLLVSIVVASQIKKRRSKDVSKISDTSSEYTESSSEKISRDFNGYFMPNYNNVIKDKKLYSIR